MHTTEFYRYATRDRGLSGVTLHDYTQRFNASISPMIIEERPLHMAQVDVFSRLMMDRIIFLGVGIDDYVANVVQAQLLFLHSVDPQRDIQMYINSPGGSVTAGLGIYDTMRYVGPDVATTCTSLAASMGAVLLSSGTPGKRSALPHARVMIHQPAGSMQGQVSDMQITYDLFRELQDELYRILAENTEQEYEVIAADCDRDKWMAAGQARDYGLIDEVLAVVGRPTKA